MPILNRAAELQQEVAGWRRTIHSRPELDFDLYETAAFVEARLKEFECDEIHTGIAKTGLVALIKGNLGEGPTIGMRADMDALPLTEITGVAYASTNPGAMHACGHDGHTAMLLGAAKYLAETRNFAGTVALIFQPAEEGRGGGRVMVEEGMIDRFGIEKVFAMHNLPGLPVGKFATRAGPIMAATAEFTISIKGRGGHAAQPNRTIDPILVGSQLVQALQAVVARNTDPIDSAVLSVTKFHGGDAFNVIPETVELAGTVRVLRMEVQEATRKHMLDVCHGIGLATGAEIALDFRPNYPVTFNHAEEAAFASDVAMEIAGEPNVDRDIAPMMGGEDFSYLLEQRPGAMMWVGNGPSAGLHNPAYDFNDEAIAHGISYWVKLAEAALPAGSREG